MNGKAIELLGPRFTGSVIEDEVMEPYFITCTAGSCYTVSKKRIDKYGKLKYTEICYPCTLEGCLNRIAKEKVNGDNGIKSYNSLREYVDSWQKTVDELSTALEKVKMKKI